LTDDPQTFSAGRRLGRYELLAPVAKGGMGQVWLGRLRGARGFHKLVAVKTLLPVVSNDERMQRMMLDEARLASLIHHSNVVQTLELGDQEGCLYMIMEWVDGEPLSHLIACADRAGGFPRPIAINLVAQTLRGLQAAHELCGENGEALGVVHRDVSPHNVLVSYTGVAKLLDFGIAKAMNELSSSTATGEIKGKFAYMAPEQILGGAVDQRADLFAAGILLYLLTTGRHPFKNHNTAGVLHSITSDDPVLPPRSIVADYPEDLEFVVLKALAKDPAARYQSVDQLAQDIRRFLQHRPVRARPPSAWHRVRLFVLRHRAACLAAAAGVGVAAVFGAAAWQQHMNTDEERRRADTVRDFMFDLIDDAEPDEAHPDAEPTGRQMVAGAVQRAREGFARQPRLRGELLSELARMRARLGDGEGSAVLLEEALGLLQAQTVDDDAPLNKTRAALADFLLAQGKFERSRQLAEQALSQCRRGAECAKARFYADNVLGNLELRHGRTDLALARMRDGVDNCRAGFGDRHPETVVALQAMAVVARQAGDLTLARSTLDQALDLSRDMTLRLADRVELQRTRAVLSMDLGDLADAQRRIEALLPQARAEGERALLWRLLATVRVALEQPVAALEAADQALLIARGRNGDPEVFFAHQAHARALVLGGDAAGAVKELQEVVKGLRDAGYADAAMEVLRARRFHAQAVAATGQQAAALVLLQALGSEQDKVQSGQQVEFAQTLEAAACLLQGASRFDEAAALHRRAAELFEKRLPPDHPLRRRNTLYQQEVARRSPAACVVPA